MSMIKQVDGGYLLQALRAGRQDRMAQQEWEAKQASQKAAAERQGRVDGLIDQYIGGDAPAQTGARPQGLEASFESAFNAPTMEAIARGENPPMPPQETAPQAPARRRDPDILRKLAVLDPEMGAKIVSSLKSLDEMALKQAEAKNASMGAAAQTLMRLPEAEREEMLRVIAPQMFEQGWSGEELARADLSDRGLQMYVGQAMDVDAMIDNELAEREFNAGKVTPVQENGMLIRTMPDGTSEVIAAPAGYSGGQGGGTAGLPTVSSPDEARKLPPGTQFRLPDGRIGTVPGGASGNAGGGF